MVPCSQLFTSLFERTERGIEIDLQYCKCLFLFGLTLQAGPPQEDSEAVPGPV